MCSKNTISFIFANILVILDIIGGSEDNEE